MRAGHEDPASAEELRERREQEAEALACIYDEAEVVAAGDAALAVQVLLTSGSRRIAAMVRMDEAYPSPAAELSVSFECTPPLDPEEHETIGKDLSSLCRDLAGRECAYDVLQALEAHVRTHERPAPPESETAEHCAHEQSGEDAAHADSEDACGVFGVPLASRHGGASDGGDQEVCVIRLDHIRDHKRYLKTVKGWAQELGLCGRVVLSGRLILIILGGKREDLSRYLVLHRTTNIDVDSNGRRCKERLLEVILREHPGGTREDPCPFEVLQPSSHTEVEKILVATSLLSEKQVREVLKMSPRESQGLTA